MTSGGFHAACAIYDERQARFAAAHRDLERTSTRLSAARLIVFAVLVLVVATAIADLIASRAATLVALILAVAFVLLVRVHGRVRTDAERNAILARVNASAGARARRSWDALPPPPRMDVSDDHPYADDLALFGRSSLWQLLPNVSPAPGRTTVSAWLTAPAGPEVVRERQEAVTELVARIDLRDELTAFAVQLEGVPPGVVRATTRLPDTIAWLDHTRWLMPVARLLTAASLATWALIASGIIPLSAAWLPILVCGAFWSARAGRMRKTFAAADVLATSLPWYADIIDRLTVESFASQHLQRLGRRLSGERHGAGRALRQLRRILQRAEVRYSPMLHIPLQVIGLWDFHIADALARWCRVHRDDIESWFIALGEIEALAAFAGLHHANPGWCLPVLREARDRDDVRIRARQLGHPLLAPEMIVPNDLTIGPPGTFVLVTGSNMSGKSTLLRAVGLNTVLAQAGAPVCAASFELPPVRVHTSVQVHDSLADGISLFMAELRRLRRIVDDAEEPQPESTVLYLLDEMLHGTNSAERHVAARTVLARLVRSRAIGLVTTHDVALASAPELVAVAVPVFFDESVREADQKPLSFDYRLRQGVVPSGNAMRLLALVGLAEPKRG